MYLPDPTNYLCSLPDCQISRNCFACRVAQICKIVCGVSDAPGSDLPHKIIRYWFYYPTRLAILFPSDQNGLVEIFCTGYIPTPKG